MPVTLQDEEQKAKVIERLHQSVMAALDPKELELVRESSRLVFYEPGAFIIREGSLDTRMFCLISGAVEVRKGDHTVASLGRSGDLFGELGVIDGGTRSASVVATGDRTVCLSIDAAQLRREGKDLQERILDKLLTWVLADRLRETTSALAEIQDRLSRIEEELDRAKGELTGYERAKRENQAFQDLFKSIQRQIAGLPRRVPG
jgi:CRP-like cAMP-binding protein